MKKITIEYCVGVGANMLFPEYHQHTLFMSSDDDGNIEFTEVEPEPKLELEDA